MKKVFVVISVVAVSIFFCLLPYAMAGQDTVPPLLIQQPIAQSPVPGVPPAPPAPPAPGTPPGPPVTTPLAGPGISQTVPVQTLLNNLSIAATTVKKISNQLIPGKIWSTQGPAGEIEIKAGILYRGSVVAVIHFNPLDGSVLPLGMQPRVYQSSHQIQTIKARLPSVVHELKILPAAEFREPEASWIFPVALGNTIVAHLKIYYDGIHIVPDYPANQEMIYYGQ